MGFPVDFPVGPPGAPSRPDYTAMRSSMNESRTCTTVATRLSIPIVMKSARNETKFAMSPPIAIATPEMNCVCPLAMPHAKVKTVSRSGRSPRPR